MRRQQEHREARPPVGWFLLAVLCAAAFWLGQAVFAGRGAHADAAIPNDLFAAREAAQDVPDTQPEKIVCLTFDDGPSRNTAPILSILAEQGVPATFFVTAQGVNADYMDQIADIAAQGHQVALHSASHEYSKIYASASDFWLDIKALRQALEPYVDVSTIHWLRFPGGSTNTVSHKYGGKGIMKTLIADCAEKGYRWIDWNVCAEDATRSHPDAAQILENIRHDAEGRDTCVVLMHDTKNTAETVKALPDIIAWFREQGYAFLTVEQMDACRGGEKEQSENSAAA